MTDYAAQIATDDRDGPVIQVRTAVDPWGLRGPRVVLTVLEGRIPGMAPHLDLGQVDDLIGHLEACRDHLNGVDFVGRPDPDAPDFAVALPPKTRDSKYHRFAAALREAPGMWAKYPSRMATKESASTTAARINSGRAAAFPRGEFEAQSRGTTVFVRSSLRRSRP